MIYGKRHWHNQARTRDLLVALGFSPGLAPHGEESEPATKIDQALRGEYDHGFRAALNEVAGYAESLRVAIQSAGPKCEHGDFYGDREYGTTFCGKCHAEIRLAKAVP